MPIQLFRVDERLIHGQVVVGWGSRLHPDRYVVVDDGLAEGDWEQQLYALGVPEGVEAEFVTVEEGRTALDRWRHDRDGTVILTRDVETMLRLAREGTMEGDTVNVGGIHHAPGRTRVLDYVFLDDDDRRRLRELSKEGVEVVARDLPTATRIRLARLLSS